MLRISTLSKRFGDHQAVSGVTLEIPKGEFFSLLGPSGCGKTTLLRIIAGLLDPDEGSVDLDSVSLLGVPAYQRNVNTVFQQYALFPHMTVSGNVAFGLRMKRVQREEIERRVRESLELVELSTFASRRIQDLSGGQQQRVAIARAVINRPALLLLDEPMAALDVKLRKQMQTDLRHLQRKLGMTFLYVTHDQDEALSMSDRIGVMHEGQLVQVGTPNEVYQRPQTRFVAEFIGEANIFEGTARDDGECAVIECSDGESIRARCARPERTAPHAVAMVRPEKIGFSDGTRAAGSDNLIRGTVEEIVYLGSARHVFVRTARGRKMSVLLHDRSGIGSIQEGESVTMTWSPADTHLIIS